MDFERSERRDLFDNWLHWVFSIVIYWGAARGLWILFKSHWTDVATTRPNVVAFLALTVVPMLAWSVCRLHLFAIASSLRAWIVDRTFPEAAAEA